MKIYTSQELCIVEIKIFLDNILFKKINKINIFGDAIKKIKN